MDGGVELGAALQEVELHHEEEALEVAAQLAHEVAGCGCGSACEGKC